MTQDRFGFIEGMIEAFDDLPDGAFLAALEEQGIGVDDLVEYERKRKHERRRKAARPAPRDPSSTVDA